MGTNGGHYRVRAGKMSIKTPLGEITFLDPDSQDCPVALKQRLRQEAPTSVAARVND